MALRILDQLNWGWSAETDFISKTCQSCFKDLVVTETYWCEQNKKYYCKKCSMKHTILYGHTDWILTKIIKVEKV